MGWFPLDPTIFTLTFARLMSIRWFILRAFSGVLMNCNTAFNHCSPSSSSQRPCSFMVTVIDGVANPSSRFSMMRVSFVLGSGHYDRSCRGG